MNIPSINGMTQEAFHNLVSDPTYGRFVDIAFPVPQTFCGSGPIRLIILGQDPTVKNENARRSITTVLNLDKSGSLRTYLLKVCNYLGVEFNREVYATNLYKNFFIAPPTQISEMNIFQKYLPYWLPVLQAELAHFPGIPVLTLGEPLLGTLVCNDASSKVRDYWGYTTEWKAGRENDFAVLPAAQNILDRLVFPYPHQPSWQRKKFYSDRLERYCKFVLPFLSS